MLHDKNTTSYVDELMSVAKVMRHPVFKKPLLTRKEILERSVASPYGNEERPLIEHDLEIFKIVQITIMYLIQHENGSFVCGMCENNRRDLYLKLDEETDPLGYTKFWFTPVSYDGLCETIPLDSFQFEGINTPNEEGVDWWTK